MIANNSNSIITKSASSTSAEISPAAQASGRAHEWLAQHFTRGQAEIIAPFSFTCGGQPSAELLARWPMQHDVRVLDDTRIEHSQTWTDPDTQLQVKCMGIEYCDFPTIEWVVHFLNTGAQDSPVLADIQAIDVMFERTPAPPAPAERKIIMGVLQGEDLGKKQPHEFVLHHQTGSPCLATDYQPFETVLGPNAETRIATIGGRSSNSDLPYFNLALPNEGIIVVVGWPAQWAAQFQRDSDVGLRVRAGQEQTQFVLHAGESARSPSMVVQFYEGDWIDGQNIWRRWMVAHNMPHPHGQVPQPIASACIDGQFPGYRSAASDQLSAMSEYLREDMPLTHWWIDAGWYPCENWTQIGTWQVDRGRYPNGIREVFDAAHANNYQTVLWFEPERVRPGSEIDLEHGEWLVKLEGRQNRLFDLGNPEARKWITQRINQLMDSEAIDLYRQDFNFDPLDYWRAQDATAENRDDGLVRAGISENKYVDGYLAFWDGLREQHPDMLIDSCSSGGRRNDIETLRRSVPLLQSDYRFEPVSQQCHNYGISFWMPYHGTGTDQTFPDAYIFRSHSCSALGYGWDLPTSAQGKVNFTELRRLMNQWRGTAPYYLADYYPLTPYSLESDVWMAWQFNAPVDSEVNLGVAAGGMVQAFRRADCIYESARFRLRGLEPDARYSITNLDDGQSAEWPGRDLMTQGLLITLADQPGSALFIYKRMA